MKRLLHKTMIIQAALALVVSVASCGSKDDKTDNEAPTTRRERNLIKEGNNHYKRQEYAQAEVANRKAVAENPSSDVARYNLASSLAHMDEEKAKAEADSLFTDIAKTATNLDASQRSFYNLGNDAYRGEDYGQSIEMYKDALRRNPTDDNARENLRLAQLKLQEQQQNQDQNQDQDNDDQQQQEQEQQQQQEQNQQNQDQQNEDQQNQDQKQDENQQDQQGNKRPDQNERDQKDQQQQGGMSQANAEQILKAMENEENATRRRVEAQMKADRERKSTRRTVEKPW